MTTDEIIVLQERIGTEPDGFWGPKSIRASKRHLSEHLPYGLDLPGGTQYELRAYYGKPEDNTPIIGVDAPDWLRLYDSNDLVRQIWVHEKAAESLITALQAAYKKAPTFTRRYFGCHVDRPMRNGRLPSVHAYGAAVDLAASTNRNRQSWPVSADMPIQVMEEFAKQGWIAAGVYWGRDAMHFQRTRP